MEKTVGYGREVILIDVKGVAMNQVNDRNRPNQIPAPRQEKYALGRYV